MKYLQWGRVKAVAFKEYRHIVRDPYTLSLAVFLPLFLVVYFGLSIDFNLKDIRLKVVDRDRGRSSRQLVEVFRSSGYFRVEEAQGDPVRMLDSESAKVVLLIEPGFTRDLASGKGARAQVLVDGADNSTVGVVLGYLGGIEASAAKNFLRQKGVKVPVPLLRLESRYLFNPGLSTQWFIVPGLSVVVLAILATLLTALTVAREWENGSMEMLLATPVTPLEIILGKLLPYLVMGILIQTLIYLAARLGFGIPFRGSHTVLFAGSLLFTTACLAQGLWISVATRQQRIAMQYAMISSQLPAFLLSGFVFPIENMPLFFRGVSAFLPARWFMDLARNEYLIGPGWADSRGSLEALAALSAALIFMAARSFKKDVET